MQAFHGRDKELNKLNKLEQIPGAKLVVVTGRRRIGKSTLISKFGEGRKFYQFMGLAPTPAMTAQDQRNEFVRLLSQQTGLPEFQVDDWGKLFYLLARETSQGRVIILLDEISWMADKDPTFLSKLKSAWDLSFTKNSELILILCGSVSVWIEEHIVGSTAFMGRPSLELYLDELPLEVCNEFWGPRHDRISAYEKLKLLAVMGGVPRYLELIDPNKTAEDNIRNLCFIKNGILTKEFNHIFSDVFGKKTEIYREILRAVLTKNRSQQEIAEELGRTKGGDLSLYLNNLVKAGFIHRDFTWDLKTGKLSKLSHYRLSDNYLRFYLKYIEPNLPKIEKNLFESISITSLPGWESMMGLQFENLIYKNEKKIFRVLDLNPSEIVFANPYYQTRTSERSGCQIDYLIQTKFNSLFVCEIKFSKQTVTSSIIEEVQEKINRLQFPKNYSYRPVLIHVNGVSDEVIDQQYFSAIIDFSVLLNEGLESSD